NLVERLPRAGPALAGHDALADAAVDDEVRWHRLRIALERVLEEVVERGRILERDLRARRRVVKAGFDVVEPVQNGRPLTLEGADDRGVLGGERQLVVDALVDEVELVLVPAVLLDEVVAGDVGLEAGHL